MSKVRASLTPNLRAKLDALLVLWAAPGMNNPEDPKSPSGPATSADPAALGAARDRDSRSQTQRNHDALEAMATALIANDGLGNSQTLPAHLVITASVRDLERGDGIATTATGTRVPVRNLVELAADATPWLQIFANHTSSVLYFGRGGRLASLPQRLALFGRDRGCTAPGCTRSFIATQAHHLPDWQDGGVTNIDHLGAACGGHNRIVGKNIGDWETEIIDKGPHTGRVGWRPTGSNQPWQVNHAHQPERILRENGPAEPGNPAAHRKRTA